MTRLLTTPEVAELLRCSPDYVRRLVQAGELAHVKRKGTNAPLLFREGDVEAWLQARVVPAKQHAGPTTLDQVRERRRQGRAS